MMKLYILIFIGLLLVVVCTSNGRPDIPEAKKQFMQLYPGVEIISVHILEDEVHVRWFTFRYRKPGETEEKEIQIQFMKNRDTKLWEPRPSPPSELP